MCKKLPLFKPAKIAISRPKEKHLTIDRDSNNSYNTPRHGGQRTPGCRKNPRRPHLASSSDDGEIRENIHQGVERLGVELARE
jgi:hypothetical protein